LGNISSLETIRLFRGAMKVTCFDIFLLRTYVPIHFFMIGPGVCHFFYNWVVNIKSLGITDLYNIYIYIYI